MLDITAASDLSEVVVTTEKLVVFKENATQGLIVTTLLTEKSECL